MNELKVPICRSCKAPKINQEVRAEFVYCGKDEHKFWHCSHCDLVYLWPVPTLIEEKRFYTKEFEKFMEIRSGEDRDWSGPEEHIKTNQDNVIRRMKFMEGDIKNNLDVLEIGCSSGFMMDAFREAKMNPIGIEPSGGFTDFLKNRGHIFYPDIETLKEINPNMKFDLIVHFFVLEHIRDTKQFIQEQLNLLKEGGVIIAEVPCVNDPLTTLYDIIAFEKFYWSIAHHYYFSPKSISYILDQLECKYKLIPEQRYDLSNHFVWMQYGKPGGQGKYSNVFSNNTIKSYKNDLKNNWFCDTFFLYIYTL
ncbi:class I SAM-dependent methyltransferase [Caldithrix abyssi]|nr:class I SAM-dependent methyltransferase [Caldithrix abyssi]